MRRLSPPPLPRGNARKRQAILAGAKLVFLDQGFADASMDAVAARAKVSKMTVYRHFGSKEELFAGLVADLCDRISDASLRAAMADQPLAKALRTFGRRMLDIVFDPETVKLHRMVIAESARFPALGRLFYERGPEASIAMLADQLLLHRAEARLSPAGCRMAAEEFLEGLRGYPHTRLLLGVGRRLSARQKEDRIDRAIARLLGTRPSMEAST